MALFSQRPVNSNTKHSSQRKSDELDLTIQVLEILHCLVWHNIICPSSLNAIFKIVLGEGGIKLLLYKIPYELNNESFRSNVYPYKTKEIDKSLLGWLVMNALPFILHVIQDQDML